FEMPAVRVHEALSRGLGVDTAEAERMARYFTAEPLALSDMFGAGLWHRPIIQLPGRSGVLIATAVLQSANLIYVLERLFKATRLDAALEKGSLGLAYEDRVRSKFGQALSRNQTLSDARVAPTAITRKAPDDEEIDLVLRVETLIIVGEIKCFVRPTDPIDR